jgi:hypothetical protein
MKALQMREEKKMNGQQERERCVLFASNNAKLFFRIVPISGGREEAQMTSTVPPHPNSPPRILAADLQTNTHNRCTDSFVHDG